MSEKHASISLYVRALPGLRLRDKRVEWLARKVRAVAPWLEASDFPAVRAWSEMEYLINPVYAELASMGVLNRQGEARRLSSSNAIRVQLKFTKKLKGPFAAPAPHVRHGLSATRI
jgi:hypothetical protein